MARPIRIIYEGAIYHITVRGHSRGPLFGDDRDRRRFLERLEYDVVEFGVRLYACCLMSNHYHLVVETPLANISAFMQSLQTSYHLYYNQRHRRSGQVSQGRFKARLVEGDQYLLKLTRYVHLNMVQTRPAQKLPLKERIKVLRAYPWSSYRGYIGKERRKGWVDCGPMLALLESHGLRGAKGYQRFVESDLAESDEEFHEIMRASPYAIGSEGFVEQIRNTYDLLLKTKYKREDTALRRLGKRLKPEAILATVARVMGQKPEDFLKRTRDSWNRAVAVKMLCRYGSMTRRAAARFLRMGSGAAASLQLKALEEARQTDRYLRNLVLAAEEECSKLIT
ncbi:MAG: transposase [Verrucomicrobia bacterium]|nr:transposase [Verrucomicrobiota bacterium]